MYTHRNSGTCSRAVNFDIVDHKLTKVEYIGGCDGNTTGLAALLEGMDVDEAIRRLDGIDCHGRGTSCPDQLAQGLKSWKKKYENT